jgi:predicted regulator of Ras-like GTPase activity (Roadblock/LC7/MglB family)
MEALDKIAGLIGYAVVNAEDGSVQSIRGSSTAPIGDLTAFFSSAGEVIGKSLALGDIEYVSLSYGSKRLVVFPHGPQYVGIEVERVRTPDDVLTRVRASISRTRQVDVKLAHSIRSKIYQINLLVDEFGGRDQKQHWCELLSQGIGFLGGDIVPYVGVMNDKLIIKEDVPHGREEDFVQALRSVIDFLVKKAVAEMGSSLARQKVQAVIAKMK